MKRIKKSDYATEFFYKTIPKSIYTQNIFYELLYKRMKILRLVENNISNLELLQFNNLEEDVASHFICRVVSGQLDWTLKWFVNIETRLLGLKLNSCNVQDLSFEVSNCTNLNNLIVIGPYKKDKLINLHFSTNIVVHFSRISDCLSTRSIKFKKGYAFIQEDSYKSLIRNEYRQYLDIEMNRLKNILNRDTDERLLKICQNVFNKPTSSTFKYACDLNIHKIHFPPCITQIIDTMESKKHIKYNDRQAIQLFFKEINVSVEDTINFFKDRFNCSKQDFDKEHLYNIRHNYGLEGKKADYKCFQCTKMISLQNTAGKKCCPFIDKGEYIRNKYKNIDIEDIFRDPRPTFRCKKFLETITNTSYDSSIQSPINYYVTSMKNKQVTNKK